MSEMTASRVRATRAGHTHCRTRSRCFRSLIFVTDVFFFFFFFFFPFFFLLSFLFSHYRLCMLGHRTSAKPGVDASDALQMHRLLRDIAADGRVAESDMRPEPTSHRDRQASAHLVNAPVAVAALSSTVRTSMRRRFIVLLDAFFLVWSRELTSIGLKVHMTRTGVCSLGCCVGGDAAADDRLATCWSAWRRLIHIVFMIVGAIGRPSEQKARRLRRAPMARAHFEPAIQFFWRLVIAQTRRSCSSSCARVVPVQMAACGAHGPPFARPYRRRDGSRRAPFVWKVQWLTRRRSAACA